jgi:hypothetical protein
MKFKLQLLHIKCHVLEFTKHEAQKMLQKIIKVFFRSVHLSRQTHTLRPRRKWASSDDLYLRVPVGNPALIGLDLLLTALVGITGRRRKILTCTQINKNNKSKNLSDYAQQNLSCCDLKATISRLAKTSSEITDSSLLAPPTNHF